MLQFWANADIANKKMIESSLAHKSFFGFISLGYKKKQNLTPKC